MQDLSMLEVSLFEPCGKFCILSFNAVDYTTFSKSGRLYGVYNRKEIKADRIRRLSDLPEADDIIFNEIAIARYGSVKGMKNAFNKLSEKSKRGRPKKAS